MVNRTGVLIVNGFSHDLEYDSNKSIENLACESHFGLSESLRETFDLGPVDLDLTSYRIYKGMSLLLHR